jgi:chromosomal replication initiation ATPase DnaA
MSAPFVETDLATRAKVLELAEPIERATGVTLERMLGDERCFSVSRARQELMAALWRNGKSSSEIGRVLGRDHATVLYGLRRSVPQDEYLAGMATRRGGRRLRVAA